jgi:hypothetical protein
VNAQASGTPACQAPVVSSTTGRQRLRRAQSGETSVSVAVTTVSLQATACGSTTVGPGGTPALPSSLAALLEALGSSASRGDNNTTGNGTSVLLLSSFISSAALESGVPASAVSLSLLAGVPAVVSSTQGSAANGDPGVTPMSQALVVGASVGGAIFALLFLLLLLLALRQRMLRQRKDGVPLSARPVNGVKPEVEPVGVNPILATRARSATLAGGVLPTAPSPSTSTSSSRRVVQRKSDSMLVQPGGGGGSSGSASSRATLAPTMASSLMNSPVFAASAGRIVKAPTTAQGASAGGARPKPAQASSSMRQKRAPHVLASGAAATYNPLLQPRPQAVSSASTAAPPPADAQIDNAGDPTTDGALAFVSNPLRGRNKSSISSAGGVDRRRASGEGTGKGAASPEAGQGSGGGDMEPLPTSRR